MDLTFQEKEVIKSVIEGFTYHQKYKLYTELAKELKEPNEFVGYQPKALGVRVKPPKSGTGEVKLKFTRKEKAKIATGEPGVIR